MDNFPAPSRIRTEKLCAGALNRIITVKATARSDLPWFLKQLGFFIFQQLGSLIFQQFHFCLLQQLGFLIFQ